MLRTNCTRQGVTYIIKSLKYTLYFIYSGGDAYAQGFGAMHNNRKEILITVGDWCLFVREGNHIWLKILEGLKKKGGLRNVEMFLFTYNMVAEYA